MFKKLLVTFFVVAVCSLTANAASIRQVEAGITDTKDVNAPVAPVVTQSLSNGE